MMIQNVMEKAKEVAIGGHIRPDGDCAGSTIGLKRYLELVYPEAQVDLYLEKIPEHIACIQKECEILHQVTEEKTYDVFFCLDCGSLDRLGFSGVLFEKAKKTVCIDHHISNQAFADINVIEPMASSTSQLVYDQLDPDKIDYDIAECLYLGIVHDTGVFQYSSTSPHTMRVAADLMEKGLDAPRLITETYYEKTYSQQQVLGRALMESVVFMEGKCIASWMTRKEMKFYGVTSEDMEGVVSKLRETEGVEVSIFLYELQSQEYKVSLRSRQEIDVSKIAVFFGGGGHRRAAGFTAKGTPYDAINNISRLVKEQYDAKKVGQE